MLVKKLKKLDDSLIIEARYLLSKDFRDQLPWELQYKLEEIILMEICSFLVYGLSDVIDSQLSKQYNESYLL